MILGYRLVCMRDSKLIIILCSQRSYSERVGMAIRQRVRRKIVFATDAPQIHGDKHAVRRRSYNFSDVVFRW